MTIRWSAIVAELARAGLSGEEIAAAVARIEQDAALAGPETVSSATPKRCHRGTVRGTVSGPAEALRESPASAPKPPGRREDLTDLAAARTALAVAPNLTRAASAVGAVLLDHYNTATGLCCPSVQHIVERAGYARRSVIRGLDELVAAGLFVRQRGGGAGHTSRYVPCFAAARALVERFEAGRRAANGARNGAVVAPGRGKTVPGMAPVTLDKKNPPLTPPVRNRRRGGGPPSGQQEMLLPIAGGRPTAERAHGVLNDALMNYARGRVDSQAIIETVCTSDDAYLAAHEAEMRAPGSGWAVLAGRLGLVA